MQRTVARLICSVSLFSVVLGLALPQKMTAAHRKRFLIRGRPWHGLVPKPDLGETPSTPKAAVAGTFTQLVDHFDPANTATFRQASSFDFLLLSTLK